MKKRLSFILLAIFLLPIVNAQEIKILGQTYSLILVAPVVFMAFVVIIFLFIFIKDTITKIHMPHFHHKSPKAKANEENEKIESKDFSLLFNNLKNESTRLDLKSYFDQLTLLIKDYIRTKHNIKQEFIFEELNDIRGFSKDELILANNITSLKYSGVELSKDKIYEIEELFKKLIGFYPYEISEMHKVSLFSKLKGLFKKKEHRLLASLPSPELPAPEAPINVTNVLPELQKPEIISKESEVKVYKPLSRNIFFNSKRKKILKLINEALVFLYKNPLKAKRYFGRALLKYNKLKIIEDKEISFRLNSFIIEILKIYPSEKHFFDVSKKIIELKHKGEDSSFESLRSIQSFKNIIHYEEKLLKVKLKEFSNKLELENRKLQHLSFVENKEFPQNRPFINLGEQISLSTSNFEDNNKNEVKEIKNKNLGILNEEKTHLMGKLEQIPEPEHEEESFSNLSNKKITMNEILVRKNQILELLKKAYSVLKEDPKLAKKYYLEALFKYYKLPVKKENLIYSKIMRFYDEMLKHHGYKHKELFDISKKIIKLKHKDKHMSEHGLSLINKLKREYDNELMKELPKVNLLKKRLSFNKLIKEIPKKIKEPELRYKIRRNITAKLPHYTKVKQVREILPTSHVETLRNFHKPSKRFIELKREEQDIYDKLAKLSEY